MIKNKFKILALAGVIAIGALTSNVVSARTVGYNLNVPGFNGFVKEDGSKYYNGGTGYIYSGTIGGKYKLDARFFQNGKGTSWGRIDDNTTRAYSLSGFTGSSYGKLVHMHLSTDLVTPVTVNAVGEWDAY